jgi:hypothetical protein
MTLPSTLMRGSDLKRAAKAIASVASASGIRLRRAEGHSCSILAAAPPDSGRIATIGRLLCLPQDA